MNRRLTIAVVFTLVLIGLLWIPFTGEIENNFVFFLGRFHPLILHLPIGALVILFFMEIIHSWRKELDLEAACNLLLWFSTISIFPTVLLGFFLASTGDYDDELLSVHKRLGWFKDLIIVRVLVLRHYKSSKSNRKDYRFYKIFLSINVILLSLAGHY
jgi:uncharacterized membrane protein